MHVNGFYWQKTLLRNGSTTKSGILLSATTMLDKNGKDQKHERQERKTNYLKHKKTVKYKKYNLKTLG